MDEIKIGAEIVFNITGNHNIGYAKGEKYIGTVLSEDHRSRLYVRTIGMPRACIMDLRYGILIVILGG